MSVGKINVTNLGPAANFTLLITDILNLVTTVTPDSGYLEANESITVTVETQAPTNADYLVGRTTRVISARESGGLPRYNYLSFDVKLVLDIDDDILPGCKVVWNTVETCGSVSSWTCSSKHLRELYHQ